MRKVPGSVNSIRTHRTHVRLFQRSLLYRSIQDSLQLLMLAGTVAGSTSVTSASAGAAVETCGTPPLLKDTEAAVLLWENCSKGTWTLKATGGGSETLLTYSGTLTGSKPSKMVTGSSIESDDILDTSDPTGLQFLLRTTSTFMDGFDFAYPSDAAVCVDVSAPGKTILVGPNRTPVTSPVDLHTMLPCTTESCGTPAYDAAKEQGTFLWKDCDTEQWHLRVTAGGRSGTFNGSTVSDQPIASVQGYSLEPSDALAIPLPAQVTYTMGVGNSGYDGLDFSLAQDATACLDACGPVLVGAGRIAVPPPFDIPTLEPRNNAPPPPPPPPEPNPYAYLNDADTTDSVEQMTGSDLGDRPFPRISTGPIKQKGTPAQFAKYGVVATKPGWFQWISEIQAVSPDTVGLRVHCPQEYQGFSDVKACAYYSGMPFESSGPSTSACDVYAGHWLYAPGTTLTGSITPTSTTLPVADASRFKVGRHVVIYDGGPGAFLNAEHAEVKAVNTSSNTLTLVARGYKSTPYAHSAGAIVAEHVIGNREGGADPRQWVYNLSTTSPRDATGRQLNEVMAEWLADHWDEDQFGNPSTAKVQGILFDSDFHFFKDSGSAADKIADVDNDLIVDDGMAPSGENLWGEGLESFYTLLRERLPNALIVSGVTEARGYTTLNGTQLEGWPQRGNFTSSVPDYRDIDGRLSAYSVQMHHGIVGPRYLELSNRQPTLLYPDKADVPPTSNATFRFSFGLGLLEDGYYGQENWHYLDPWWDEYAVDAVRGSPTFGQAIASNPSDESSVISHSGWMGYPRGPRYRIYDEATFALENNLISKGDFETGLGDWIATNVALTLESTNGKALDGTSALYISAPVVTALKKDEAYVKGPTVSVTKGRQYTLAFATKSNVIRSIEVAIGGTVQTFYIPDTWSRQVLTFTATSTATVRPKFNLGREGNELWIDSVYLFEGNADVFRRDFDNAVVIVNATPSSRTVDLMGTFKRIKGTGQDPINDGSTQTQVTINPYDAAILVRP